MHRNSPGFLKQAGRQTFSMRIAAVLLGYKRRFREERELHEG